MSLRLRLIAGLAAVLVLSLGVAAALACGQAIRSVRTELVAALAVGSRTAASLIDEFPSAGDPRSQLEALLATFDGNRHVRATVLDQAGAEFGRSRLLVPSSPPPRWFVWLVSPTVAEMRLPAGNYTVVLHGDPVNEVGEVWADLTDEALGMGTFCLLAAALMLTTVTRALRPLAQLSTAFPRLASGAWETRVSERGPSELVRLTHGFNDMAARLAAAEAQNRRLQEQLQTLQDEERAEVARDLHDEVGPLLFAAQLAATAIREGGERTSDAALVADAVGLQDVVGQMQREVRAMLRRLRPSPVADIGLAEAIGGLAAFWQRRQPEVDIRLDLAILEEPAAIAGEVLYRCVQEGLANALRHAQPTCVEVCVRAGPQGLMARIADDGALVGTDAAGCGLGLLGMRERFTALGGSVEAGAATGKGWLVTAWLPAQATAAA